MNRGRIARESVDTVLERADIVDLISGFTQLKKNGAEFLGRCPFHNERTPSFWVNPTKGVYHCFGCQKSGDTITFVSEKQGLDFAEAVEYLADRYRIELAYEDAASAAPRANRRRIYELLDAAASFYSAFLVGSDKAAHALQYLRGRGLTDETIAGFRLGFSPDSMDGLKKRALARGFTLEELKSAGLVGGKGADFFRGRVMVPIIDRADRVVGFGARKLSDEAWGGKYVNSPDGNVFHKRHTVYLPPSIKAGADEAKSVVVVEGYMDVIALWQAGIKNAVAVMGTSLTEQQIVELKRLAPRAYFAFDPDAAGQVATLRALERARALDLDVRVTVLQGGDPADVVAGPGGADEFRDQIEHSVPFLHYRVSALLGAHDLRDPSGRDAAYVAALGLFATVAASPERSEQIARFADRLQLDDSLTERLQRTTPDSADAQKAVQAAATAAGQPSREVSQQHEQSSAPARSAPPRSSSSSSPATRLDRMFLAGALVINERGAGNWLVSLGLGSEHFVLEDHRSFWDALTSTGDNSIDISTIRSDSGLVGLVAELSALAQKERLTDDLPHAKDVVAELRDRLEERLIRRQIADVDVALKESGLQADAEQGLLVERARLEARRRAVNPRLRETAHKE